MLTAVSQPRATLDGAMPRACAYGAGKGRSRRGQKGHPVTYLSEADWWLPAVRREREPGRPRARCPDEGGSTPKFDIFQFRKIFILFFYARLLLTPLNDLYLSSGWFP